MSQTPHTRLTALWKQLMKLHDFKSAIIHLDPKTHHDLIMSHDANNDGSIRGYGKWRDIPIDNSHRGFRETLPIASADIPSGPTDIIHDPVCIYIEAIKENGRHVYFDDPATDIQFL
jgi:hypothetical protein